MQADPGIFLNECGEEIGNDGIDDKKSICCKNR